MGLVAASNVMSLVGRMTSVGTDVSEMSASRWSTSEESAGLTDGVSSNVIGEEGPVAVVVSTETSTVELGVAAVVTVGIDDAATVDDGATTVTVGAGSMEVVDGDSDDDDVSDDVDVQPAANSNRAATRACQLGSGFDR